MSYLDWLSLVGAICGTLSIGMQLQKWLSK